MASGLCSSGSGQLWFWSALVLVGGLVLQGRLRADGALHGCLQEPGEQVDPQESPPRRPHPVPPQPALRLHLPPPPVLSWTTTDLPIGDTDRVSLFIICTSSHRELPL